MRTFPFSSGLRAAILWCGLMLAAFQVQAQKIDVARYDLFKGQQFIQNGSAVTLWDTNAFVFQARLTPLEQGWVKDAFLVTPTGTKTPMITSASGSWSYNTTASSSTIFTTNFGAGEYKFNYQGQNDGDSDADILLGPDNYPNAPQVLNLTDAQSWDIDDVFILQWLPFAGGTAQDAVQLQIKANDGAILFSTPSPGEDGALDGTMTSLEISPELLFPSTNYTAKLTFYKLNPAEQLEIPFIYSGFYSETTFPITTVALRPNSLPQLLWTNPTNNTAGISTDPTVPITFRFSDQMVPSHSIQWSDNLAANGFTYQWSTDKTTLMCYYTNGFPANATITWTLNPGPFNEQNFKDLSGDQLAIAAWKGQFTTMPGPKPVPYINSVKANPGKELQFEVTCTVGKILLIQSSPDLKQWSDVLNTNATIDTLTFRLSMPTNSVQFYRAGQK